MNEREILEREEVDFRRLVIRLLRAWPILLISALICMLIAFIFLQTYPPVFSAKTSFLIEKPKGVNDPGTIVSELAPGKPVDDTYYRNQKIGFNVYPIVKRTVQELGLEIGYLKKGLFDTQLYQNCPIRVEVDESYKILERSQVPYSVPFYICFEGEDRYSISADGEYPITGTEFEYSGEHAFSEWVTVDNIRFKVEKDETFLQTYVGKDDYREKTYGFRINNVDAMSLYLMKSLEVSQAETDASIVQIKMEGNSHALLLDVLEQLGELYIQDHLSVKTAVVDKAEEFLDAEIQKNIAELIEIENDIEKFKTSNESARLSEIGLLKNKESLELENQKVTLMLKERYYEYLEGYLLNNSNYTDLISPNAFGLKDPLITQLTQSLVSKNQEAASMEASGTTANPRYQQLRATIEQEKNTILNTVTGFRASNRIAAENIDSRIFAMDAELADLPRVQRELQRLERLYRVNESLYNDLQKKKSTIALNKASITPDIRMIEPPFLTSLKPVFPNPKVIFALAFILGVVLPLGFLLVKMVFVNTIDEEADLAAAIPELPVLATLSNTTIRDFRDLNTYQNSRMGQQLGIVVYGLQKRFGDPQVIMLTSSRPDEGKSYLTSLLGAKNGQMGKKTLIVDANLPDPKLHRYLNLENEAGLADILKGDAYIMEVQQDTIHPDVKLLTAGTDSRHADLDVERFKMFLEEAKKDFERIIIDTSPLGLVSEVVELVSVSDHTIIVTRRSKTTFDDIHELRDLVHDGLLDRCSLLLTDTFDPGTRIHPFRRWDKYQQERGAGIFGTIQRLFKRI
ncbi:MAG: hypothetical protein HKN79_04995 [Flavobacteriales bacterium]|nr:hypothetical protein [Flavobacteriales bacterium]